MPDSADVSASDPHRRVRRHHYQEGPGFLFLATQNGRPSQRLERPSLAEVRRRMRLVRHALAHGAESAVRELGVARRSVFRWLAAFQANGIEGLVPKSRRPNQVRSSIPSWVDMVIIAIRLHTYWNSKRIAAEMWRRGIHKVSPDHIDRLFAACGCSRGTVPRPP